MGLETGTYIADLVATNPPGGDDKRQGDDHLRLIKSVLQNTLKRGSKSFYLPGASLKSTSYAVLESDENLTFVCDTTGGFVTLTLPTLDSSRYGWRIQVIKTNAGISPVFLQPASGLINGYSRVRRTIEHSITTVEWVGVWVASRPNGGAPIGSVLEYYGTTLPNGHIWANGQGYSTLDFVELASVYGGSAQPDRRGRAPFGRDDMGGVPASVLTSLGSGINGSALRTTGGAEIITLTSTQIPSHVHPVLSTGNLSVQVQSASHTHTWGQTGNTGGASGSLDHTHQIPALNTIADIATATTPNATRAFAYTTSIGNVTLGSSLGDMNHSHSLSIGGTTNIEVGAHSHAISGATEAAGGGGAHVNVPPCTVCNAIVVAE